MKTKLIVLCAAAFLGCARDAPLAQLPGTDAGVAAAAPRPVDMGPVARAAVSAPVHATGTTRPLRAANLASVTSARIEKILVKEGDVVRSGQALVQLDARAATLAVSQAEASASALHAQAAQLASDYKRLAPLASRGAVAQARIDQLATQRDATQAQAAAADAATNAARRIAVDATLTAPFAGTVVDVPMELGEMSGTKTLVRLIDLSSVEVAVRVAERDLARVSKGDPVRARFPGLGTDAEGTVARVGLEVDPASRTAELIVELPNPKGLLRAGVFAELDVQPAAQRDAILVPRTAVMGSPSDGAVYVIEGNVAHRRAVRGAPFDDTRLEILEGLSGGETIALTDVDRLREGAAVTPAEAPRAEAGGQ